MVVRVVRRPTSGNTSADNAIQTEVAKENQVSPQSDINQLDDGLPLQFQKSEVKDDNETVFTSEESSQKATELLAKAAEIKSRTDNNASLIQEPKIAQGNIDGIYRDPFGDQFADSNLETQDQFKVSGNIQDSVDNNANNETEEEAYYDVMSRKEVYNVEEKTETVNSIKDNDTKTSQQEVATYLEDANLPILSKEQIGKYQSQLQELDIEKQISRLKELNQKRTELEHRRIHLDAREEQVNKNITILTEKIQALTGKTDINEICKSLVDAYEETELALDNESELLEAQEKIIKEIENELNGL